MNWNILSATVITLVLMLSWLVMHEEYHRAIYIEEGCKVTGIVWNWQTLAKVVGECPGRSDWSEITIRNDIVDVPSQFFFTAAGVIWMISYMFMKNLD